MLYIDPRGVREGIALIFFLEKVFLRNTLMNMSFQELLAMRDKKLGGKYLTPGPERPRKEDGHGGGEGHHHCYQYHEHHH